MTPSPRASDPLADHAEAVRAFASRAAGFPEARWVEPAAPGKWSPAEVAEHLALTYAGLCAELSGGPSIRVRVRGLRLLTLRLFVLPRLLGSGAFPPGVRSPREMVPASVEPDRSASLARLAGHAAEFERLIAPRLGSRTGGITHPFFGKLTPRQGLRLIELHTRHHTRQLPGS